MESILEQNHMKYLVVCGSGLSGIGKGIVISSIGAILQGAGYKITIVKIDPYLVNVGSDNIDAGTMSPIEHGEVYVLNDGGEVDLDLGNYERYFGINLTRYHNITTGKVYNQVISKERKGEYLGKTVQVVPHITNEIIEEIRYASWIKTDTNEKDNEICLIELGGTVGDIESSPFQEALRQLHLEVGRQNMLIVLVTYVPTLKNVGEQKTKIAQHGFIELRQTGMAADIVVARSEDQLTIESRNKLALFGNLKKDHVISAPDLDIVFQLPMVLEQQNISQVILEHFNLPWKKSNLNKFKDLVQRKLTSTKQEKVLICIVGKYTKLADSYLSVTKALESAALEATVNVDIQFIESTNLEDNKCKNQQKYNYAWNLLKQAKGIIVPGGFGSRGIQGKINALQYCRENKIPMLGICYGMQLAVIEFQRHVLGYEDSTSEEIDKKGKQIIIHMPEHSTTQLGGTMRLGERLSQITKKGTIVEKLYQKQRIYERHRHRYEVNPKYIQECEDKGLLFVAVGAEKQGRKSIFLKHKPRMEICELQNHPYYIGVQFHPEFNSQYGKPSPVFYGLVLASANKLESYLEERSEKMIQVKIAKKTPIYKDLNVNQNISITLTPEKDQQKEEQKNQEIQEPNDLDNNFSLKVKVNPNSNSQQLLNLKLNQKSKKISKEKPAIDSKESPVIKKKGKQNKQKKELE